ncbi:hypothetical protein [Roseateles puraquae]|jgi:hypothetical protein|uniref:hypothetical protein n=1 Tax=Roseateles puraquae TaxID=431059 RepID=UPI0031E2964C
MQTADSREAAPIACTLSAADMGPRVARIQAMTREHLRRHELLGSALRLTYAPEAADEVARIAELGQACCAFLDFETRRHADGLEVVITAPHQVGADAKWLFSQFLPNAAAPASACPCCKG